MCQHFTHGVSWIHAIVKGPPSHAAGVHPFTSVRQQYGSRCVWLLGEGCLEISCLVSARPDVSVAVNPAAFPLHRQREAPSAWEEEGLP